jgi:hypothetical protein
VCPHYFYHRGVQLGWQQLLFRETASECMVNIYRTGIKIILMPQMYDKEIK